MTNDILERYFELCSQQYIDNSKGRGTITVYGEFQEFESEEDMIESITGVKKR